jgi:hypothetical protein
MVSEVRWHAGIAITKDVYGHLLGGDKRAADESISRALFVGGRGPWLPSWLPKRSRSSFRCGKEPLTWARSEGLEPPTF